ncbi:MAG: PAS domain S-box protein, partial [Planctomycetota bacterium]|nr:PAS domain S-box protein [Planctomycetota bacterium]
MPDKLAQIIEVLDTLHCGAALIDRRGTIVYINGRLCRMLGRRCDELKGRPVLEFIHTEEDRVHSQRSLEHFDEALDRESYLTHADGHGVPIVLSARQLPGDPPVSDHRVVTMIEITHQKAAEQRYLEQYRVVSELSDTVLEQALSLKRHSEKLEEKVRERTSELHDANMDAIYMLAVASEVRDEDTGAHVRRIEHYARLLASALGKPESEAANIGYSAILHDVGKIQVPDGILKKPGKLTPD